MDLNQLIITGQVSWHKLRMSPKLSFGSISVKLSLPKFEFELNGNFHRINSPLVWLDISVSKDNSGMFKKSDQRVLDALNSGNESYLIATGGKITNWIRKGKDGGPDAEQFKLETSSGSVTTSNKIFGVLNEGTFKGKVLSYEPSGKMIVACSYMSPMKNEWKARNIPVVCTQIYDPSLVGKKVLFFGKACSVTPDGENKLYIVTDTVYPM